MLALARIMCAYIHSQNGIAILAQACFSPEILEKSFRSRIFFLIAMASSFVVDTIVPEETQGTMPAEVPPTLGSSLDSFQHVEAIMKDDDVSTLGLDSQDWEMVSGSHVLLGERKVDLQTPLKAMEETMANLNLAAAASGVQPPPSPRVGFRCGCPHVMETEQQQTDQGKRKWLVFGRPNKALTYTLQEVPFKMEPCAQRD